MIRFRGLLATLTTRELKARYRGSVLGFFWSLVTPLLLLAVYTFVFKVVFRPRFEGADPYSLFLITGIFPWIWFSSSLLEGAMSLTANAGLIRKAVFPSELLPMVSVISNLVHLLLALPILAVALVAARFAGYQVGGWTALLFPVVILLQLPLVAGAAMAMAALNVHFKDVKDILANLLTLLFFMTPILYPLSSVPSKMLWWVVRLNPLTPFTLSYQQLLFQRAVPEANLWLQMAVVSLLAWLAGSWLYHRLSETLVEAV